MTITRVRLVLTLIVSLVAVPQSGWCGGKLDADTMKRFGGTYSSDCKSPTSPHAAVHETTVEFRHADQKLVGEIVPDGDRLDWFGRLPPEHFETMIEGTLASDQHLYLVIYADTKGPYLKVEATPDLEKKIGKRDLDLTYRRCAAAP